LKISHILRSQQRKKKEAEKKDVIDPPSFSQCGLSSSEGRGNQNDSITANEKHFHMSLGGLAVNKENCSAKRRKKEKK